MWSPPQRHRRLAGVPFLDPAHGYTAVAITCIRIFAAFLPVGGLVFWASKHGQRRPLAKSTD
jgi:hypothetical protein